MSQPIVYLSKEFFINFCKIKDVPTDDIEKKKVLLYIEELIFYKATIYINIEDVEIRRYNQIVNLKDLKSNEEIIFAKNFSRITSQNIVRSCKSEINIFENKKYTEYNELPKKPHFILASFGKEYCRDIEKEFGIICISDEFSIHESCTRAEIKIVEQGKPVDLNSLCKHTHFCNALIIEDPYLFDKKDIQGNFLEALLRKLLSSDLKVQIAVTLIFDNTEGANIPAIIARIKKNIGLDLQMEFYTRSHQNIHDRNIYSNSYWLSCDYGFKAQYPKPTKWTVLPLGTYFSVYYKRKNDSLKFMKNEARKSANRLVS